MRGGEVEVAGARERVGRGVEWGMRERLKMGARGRFELFSSGSHPPPQKKVALAPNCSSLGDVFGTI